MSEDKFALPENFGKLLSQTFDKAVETDYIAFTPSTSEILDVDGVKFQLTQIDSLSRRPTKGSLDANPFANPEPELTVVQSYVDYRIVLNKFPVVRDHFMLVTSKFVSQDTPLTPVDLQATYHTLLAANKGTGERHFAFFNCGPESGASQPHKHIQFMRLPALSTGFVPFPDLLAMSSPAFIPTSTQEPLQRKDLPFAHFVAAFPSPAEIAALGQGLDEEAFGLYFISLLQRVMTIMRENDVSSPSYNFVMTEKWMMLVPRSLGYFTDGDLLLGVNSCGVLGLVLVKNRMLYELVKAKGPAEILGQLGFPNTSGIASDEYHY
ncbi:hypothetical protein BABINDRAFT_166613 [Babjeviella inositovora NRRL Y-12698]|uniref:Uncharacterized protein n=1 Tax=Babjeviella inositovora NRRL Y-12698 TaxID=984486 RepID=A0A1E3QRF6_9ASCO|nr:uncharacterized protein BABINDRAFT_166613 [Babjeviella inositovora NRRL Y-12698]ODQ80261.1 hypothetical protein BABINDRAFT_166613 [Babjeviella inositovora NRRL Y-12698]